jgi:acetyl esterase/lipase
MDTTALHLPVRATLRDTFTAFLLICATASLAAEETPRTIDVWKGLPPGETKLATGETLPRRANENPPATRIAKITQPQLEVYEAAADKRTERAVIILPGGGYNYVVTDKEGSEAAKWLNGLGVTAFVLRYRTKDESNQPLWKRPVEDTQRAVSLLRANAAEWKIDVKQIGLLGFSAGGQVAAIAIAHCDERLYRDQDDIDKVSCRPDFALLIYPWNLWDDKSQSLMEEARPGTGYPPTFLVHTHDDKSSSLGSVHLYAALKQKEVPAELHVYRSGGHGYGMRPVAGSVVHTWPGRAEEWLVNLAQKSP